MTRHFFVLFFLVNISREIREATDLSATGLCGEHELNFKNACYYWSKEDIELVSQERAHQICENRNSSLASIDSLHENAFIAKETSPVKGSLYWIGLVYNRTSVKKSFEWLSGALVNFTKWAMYEPAVQNRNSRSCVLFGSNGQEFVWSVSNCSKKAGYICKSTLGSYTLRPF